MTTGLFTHSACLYHEPPLGHPESPDRLRAVLHALETESFQYLSRLEARRASIDEIARVHDRAYVEALLAAIPEEGVAHIDADTALSPGSGEAALRAAGALVDAVDHVSRRELKNAFCAVRPPGHHAEPARAMGFCLFNNIAVGALHARVVHGHQRIAVVDFDVHHGNGTQDMFERDADLFFGSTHQWPLYPGTGHYDERGVADNILNAPLPPDAGSDEFRAVMSDIVLPAVENFAPDFIFISAGFDAHHLDPLANLRLREEDYGWVTGQICEIAAKQCGGRVVSTLEGGYNLRALAESAKAHVRALING
jgi:acetoin utilization deacetylase AcuC-like enzyme